MRDACRIVPGAQAKFDSRATDDKLGLDKATAEADNARLTNRLSELHNRLWAEHARSVLLILQGLDASGKDGMIRRVFTGLNPQGCQVHSFKAPSPIEKDHDFLWRLHSVLPERGDIGIFNRSHYEDVTAAQVVGAIDDHERKRLQARLDDPEKRWKFQRGDLDTRAKWDTYIKLYDDAITATSTKWAPWYVVPADRKWVSGHIVATILVDTLHELDPQYPPPSPDLDGLRVE